MKIEQLISALSAFGADCVNSQEQRDRDYLEAKGWICLGAEATSGVVHWTNLERGAGPGGPVTFRRALWLQRTADRIAAIRKAESAE